MTVGGFVMVTSALLFLANGPAKGDLDQLRGTWLTVSLVNDGKTLVGEGVAPQPGPTVKLAYDGTRWMVKVGEKIVASGTFAVDPTKSPKQIDLMDETGKRNDQTKLGIYELAGDIYKYCVAPAGKPRPTELASKEGSGTSCGVSRREKP